MRTTKTPTHERKKIRANFAASPVLKFFEKNQTALWHAARLLGGYESARLVDRCSAALEHDLAITNHIGIMLDQLLALLSLEKIKGADKPHMGFFVVIDPSDPVVEEICLLADGLRQSMAEAKSRSTWAEAQEQAA